MLTYEASVTFAPHSTVTGLVLSPGGETIAWSESNGSVNIYQDMKKVNEIKCEGVVTGLTFHQEHFLLALRFLNSERSWKTQLAQMIQL